MKGMKGRLLKKMKSMKPVEYLTLHDRVLQVSNPNRYSFNNSSENTINVETQNKLTASHEIKTEHKKTTTYPHPEPGNTNINTEQEREEDEESGDENKENNFRRRRKPGFRKPDLNSHSLFDPNLLEAFREALEEHRKARRELEEAERLWEFPEKCPPGGSEAVILYTTSLRGIRKTFEGCVGVRFLLESLRVKFTERDVSMHAPFREELRRVLGDELALPPRLFVRGRDLGGPDRVLGLHESGQLGPLFLGLILREAQHRLCQSCGGARFLVCLACSGSRKLRSRDDWTLCPDCNENGLTLCPLCSS